MKLSAPTYNTPWNNAIKSNCKLGGADGATNIRVTTPREKKSEQNTVTVTLMVFPKTINLVCRILTLSQPGQCACDTQWPVLETELYDRLITRHQLVCSHRRVKQLRECHPGSEKTSLTTYTSQGIIIPQR